MSEFMKGLNIKPYIAALFTFYVLLPATPPINPTLPLPPPPDACTDLHVNIEPVVPSLQVPFKENSEFETKLNHTEDVSLDNFFNVNFF